MCGLIQAEAMTPPACEPFLMSLLEGTLSINKADFEPLQRESNFERQITESHQKCQEEHANNRGLHTAQRLCAVSKASDLPYTAAPGNLESP